MDQRRHFLPLIDLAPVYVALDSPPGGGLWEIAAFERREGTGHDTVLVAVKSGEHVAALSFHGPTVIGLGEGQLLAERERLQRIREAAEMAMQNIDAHLAFRRGLT